MKNSKVKGLLGLLVLLFAVGLFGFFGYDTMDDIKLGLDLAGGVSITYQAVDEDPTSEEMSDTIYKLQQRVQNYSTEAVVYQEGSDPGSTLIFRVFPMQTQFWKNSVSRVP